MSKKVSIIIPTYKGEKFLDRAIKTVLKQSYSFFEVIIVDDNGKGSYHQKETARIIGNFSDNRIKYIIHDYNKNGAAARNTGLKASKGEYICFLDDDDLLLEDRIKNAVEFLELNKQYDGVFSNVACCDEKLNVTRIVEINKSGNCLNNILLDDMFFGTGSNIFITRKSFEKVGYFDERFVRHQDLEFMIRFYRKFKSGVTGKIDIIKSKNGVNNIPNYDKLVKNECLYNTTFMNEINQLSEDERKLFFKKQDAMLSVSKICSSKISLSYIGKFMKISMKNKILILIVKTRINKLVLFKIINSNFKKKKYNKIKNNLPSYLIDFVDNYKEVL